MRCDVGRKQPSQHDWRPLDYGLVNDFDLALFDLFKVVLAEELFADNRELR